MVDNFFLYRIYAACAGTMQTNYKKSIALALLAIFLVLLWVAGPSNLESGETQSRNQQPDVQPESFTGLTKNGKYRVRLRPRSRPIMISVFQDWIIHVENVDGTLFIPLQLSLMGGMPGHGHGFASSPKATRYLESGDFLVEGVRFHMTGLWNLQVDVMGPSGPDSASFEVQVKQPEEEGQPGADSYAWTTEEIATLRSLALDALQPAAADPSNRLSGNSDAIKLGAALFFDPGLSSGGAISCSSCHDPARHFTDGRKRSMGSRETARHAPGLRGLAHSNWFYWDGRRDSLWAQAITPIETPGEMDSDRLAVVRYVVAHPAYGRPFLSLSAPDSQGLLADLSRLPSSAGPFGDSAARTAWGKLTVSQRRSVNRAFSDIGKAIAAYVETLSFRPARFDRFVQSVIRGNLSEADSLMTADEIAGLRIFIDQTRVPCMRCHNGPLFTNHQFHNIGTGTDQDGHLDWGRFLGLRSALHDEFNCQGLYSDAPATQCKELLYLSEGHMDHGAFKVPGLREVGATAPYMHDGRFADLRSVVSFYADHPQSIDMPDEIPDFRLTDTEVGQIAAFLETLTNRQSYQ